MIEYDITNEENAIKSISKITDISVNRVKQFINDNCIIDDYKRNAENITVEKFIEELKIDFDTIETKEIIIIGQHATTNNDNCNSIYDVGIRDLKYAVSNNTPLSQFLSRNNIKFDVDNKELRANGKVHIMSNDDNKNSIDSPINNISWKVYEDFHINCFLFIDDIEKYGELHYQPEILSDLNRLIPRYNLEKLWILEAKPYLITFKTKLSNINFKGNQEGLSNIHKLIEYALNVASGTTGGEVSVCLNNGSIVSKEMITNKECIILKNRIN